MLNIEVIFEQDSTEGALDSLTCVNMLADGQNKDSMQRQFSLAVAEVPEYAALVTDTEKRHKA